MSIYSNNIAVPNRTCNISFNFNSGSCSPNPCQNGAPCVSVPYGYVCKCLSGYKGRNCEKGMVYEVHRFEFRSH